ncbi:MAG: HDOD domain-containing protein [Proteobacteria bacterium]|nr:HDOD domain-containing protein [Pseudomonadota bacterium]MBU1716040.1 HDOD domain-containing protein [Pseudomonadota bacterium]
MNDVPLADEKRFKQLQNFIDRMPSLSTTVTKVLEVCNKPNTSPNDLNRVISLDPVLTGQVLKLINSAYYSMANQITSLTRAIIMLGLNTVKNLALSTAVLGSFGKEESFQSLSMDKFWTHSICVGVTAKILAGKRGVPMASREEYFVAGLLHDLGKIPLNNRFAQEYGQVLELARLEQGPLIRAEQMVFGFDHGLVGKIIADKWQLSEVIADALCYHHVPEQATEKNQDLVATIALADIYANIYEIGSAGDYFPEESNLKYILKMLDLDWNDLVEMQDRVAGEIEKAQIFLHVSRE